MYINHDIITKVRPIKKLYIIEKNDISKLLIIIRCLSHEIGGILNIIMLNDDKLFSKNTIAFINRHDSDIIINFSNCDNKKLYKTYKTLVINGTDNDFNFGRLSTPLKIVTNIPKMIEENYLTDIEQVYTNLDATPNNDKLIYYLNFGLVNEDITSNLQSSIFKDIKIQVIESLTVLLDNIEDHKRNFLYLSMNLYHGGEESSIWEKDYNKENYYGKNPTIIFGEENNIESMVYFWNTRATNPYNTIVWLPTKLIDECGEIIKKFADYCIFIKGSPSKIKNKLNDINNEIREIDKSKYYFKSESDPWNLFEFVQNATVMDNKLKIVHPTDKLFSSEGFNINMVLEVNNLSELFLPKSIDLGKLFRPYYENAPLYHFCRISNHGLAFYISHFNPYRDLPISEELTIPDINTIFKALFEENGLELRETNSTQITNQVINLVGGFENLRLFNNKNVFKSLVELTPKRTERLAKLLSKNLNSSLSTEKIKDILSKNKDELMALNSNLIIKTSKLISYYPGKDGEKYHQLIQQLYDKKILLRGKSFRCPHCKSLLWYPISSLEDDLKCYCCDNSISLPVFIDNGILEDSFRLNELIINAVDQGVLPVLLTTSILYKQSFIVKRFIFDNEIFDKNTSEKLAEIDLIFTLGSRVGLCEIKADRGFDKDQVERLLNVSNRVGSNIVLFSTLKDKDSEEVRDLVGWLQSMELSIPVFIFTKNVLFDEEPVDLGKYFTIDFIIDDFPKGPIIVTK